MTKKFAMIKKFEPSSSIPTESLAALNARQWEADIAREIYAHVLTQIELVRVGAEAKAAKVELEMRDAREAAQAKMHEAKASYEAARTQLSNLTTEIRRTHNLTKEHAIDGLTGAIVIPEG